MKYRIDQLRYQLREDPSSRVFNQLAELLRREGEAEEAAAILRRGLEVHPRYAAAWVGLGRALRDLEDQEGSLEAFTRAHGLDAGNVVAARAVADAALAHERWSDAVEILAAIRNAAPDDSEVAAKLADAEERIAEEVAAEEARAAQAIPVPRPPAEVISLSGDDPFADEIGASDDWATTQADVFAVADPPEAEIEGVAAEEPFDEAAADADEDPVFVGDGAAEPAMDRPFGEEPPGGDGDFEGDAEFESWADMEDDDGGAELRVEPPAEVDHDVPGEEESPAEDVMMVAESEEDLPVPEISEPDLDPLAAVPEEPEFESWADLKEDDGPVEFSGAGVETAAAEVVTDPAPEVVDGAEPVLIPEAIAHFDRPSEDEHDESGSVTASDVPLPTLTLAKLALEQGDEGLARATLERLIEQNPSDAEASEMLRGLQSGTPEDQIDVTGAKIAALRGWLDTIRLASERHST